MLLAVVLAVMTVAVVASVVVPLMRGVRAAPGRDAFDRAVYRDQLGELERDLARGLIDASEAATARLEIERRLLAADARETATIENAAPRTSSSPALALALALIVPGAAALIYLALGAPGVSDKPYAARAPERSLAAAAGGHDDMEKAASTLVEKLKLHPESDADWLLLARTEAALGHWQKSADAYRAAMRLTMGRPEVAAAYGEMLVMAADGIVTPNARDAFSLALAKDAKNTVARYYLALGEAQEGNAQVAIDAWQKLAADEPANSPLRNEIKTRIADAARTANLAAPELAAPAAGPSAADVAKAARMSPAEREQMIRGMVDGLAAKLAADPTDLDGWLRLARAYGVLGDRDQAADAYEHAAGLKPDDPLILLAEAEALMPGGGPQSPLPERAVALFQRVETIDGTQPAALWYLGLAAAQQRHFAEADGYWRRLLAVLPPESEEHKAVAAAIETLKDK
jgi:cytochrome c-type biogenesis protein CcmH